MQKYNTNYGRMKISGKIFVGQNWLMPYMPVGAFIRITLFKNCKC